jgi:carbon-monoxide dehydrogenase catalytic subunit
VDNTRILTAACNMVAAGGLGESIADLPVAGAAPEFMSEKAIAIGQYFVASGVYTVFGVTFPTIAGTKFHDLLFDGLEKQGMGKWGFAVDPHDMARMIVEHIEKKRRALGLDKGKERVLVDMADRRAAAAH